MKRSRKKVKNSDIYLEGCLYTKYMSDLKVKNLESGDQRKLLYKISRNGILEPFVYDTVSKAIPKMISYLEKKIGTFLKNVPTKIKNLHRNYW